MTTLAPDRAAASGPAPRTLGWAPLLVVLTGTFMTFLDFFIVNVALPSIQTELHAGPAAIQLVVAGYGTAFAVGMISGGRLGDLYGRRRLFTVGLALFTLTSAACGLALFTLTSAACGLAPNAGFLVIARVLQGAAGAMMTPQVLALIGTIYTGAHRARAFAAYGLAMGVAGVLGQLIGGALIQADIAGSGWRGIFLINLPVGVVGLLLVRRTVPESRGSRARLDLVGSALVTLGLVAVVLALYLQDGLGFSPQFSGVVFAAVGVGFFAAMLAAEAMTGWLGRQILALGAVSVAAGCLLLAQVAGVGSSLGLLPGLVVTGAGIGMVLVPLSSAVLRDVDALHADAASGVLSTAQQVGGALGVAVVGVVFYRALGGGAFAHAFTVSLYVLAGLTVLTAVLVQLMPGLTQESR